MAEPRPTEAVEAIELPDGRVRYVQRLFSSAESERLFAVLRAATGWRQEEIQLFGRKRLQPRLTAWHGDPRAVYQYSGIRLEPQPWSASLAVIKARVEAVSGAKFNSVLLNYYRDGRDSMGWHSDDEPELGDNPLIGSVSLGATRRFRMQHKTDPSLQMAWNLPDGSYLEMDGALQRHWRHCVPKVLAKAGVGPRINLTFRWIRPNGARLQTNKRRVAQRAHPAIRHVKATPSPSGCVRPARPS